MSKRKHDCQSVASPRKLRKRVATSSRVSTNAVISQPVLNAHYSKLCSLRDFLLYKLPSSSRARRKRISSFDNDYPDHVGFLDKTHVGIVEEPSCKVQCVRKEELIAFTQNQRSESDNSAKIRRCNIDEVLDFTVWRLFQLDSSKSRNPDHLLCYGFQRGSTTWVGNDQVPDLALPGILRRYPNTSITTLKQSPWDIIIGLLGSDADLIFVGLLLDCGIFLKLEAGRDNFYQLSGRPISQMTRENRTRLGIRKSTDQSSKPKMNTKPLATTPGDITIVRNRMFYARPSINSQGRTQLGLKHIHVFNRFCQISSDSHDLQVMRYIFPRQFKLHNVFTSMVDPSETVQPHKDYTVREYEIMVLEQKSSQKHKVPRRLQGRVRDLVHRIRRNHIRCSYTQLLRYYCSDHHESSKVSTNFYEGHSACSNTGTQFATQIDVQSEANQASIPSERSPDPVSSFVTYSTPGHSVSLFSQAVIQHLLPRDTLGEGRHGVWNWTQLLCMIDRFIMMRRFETVTLHEIAQNLRFKCITWLRPLNVKASENMSATDKAKRVELFYELLYFIFDSIIIPLLRSNFYITETNVHRNRLLYFRHDIWKKLSEPALVTLRMSVFKPLNPRQLRRSFQSTQLGYSQLRLLPKELGTRPITNLRRRNMKLVKGKRVLGTSINAQLTPVFSVLNFERNRNPHRMASAMFSVGDLRDRLKSFKEGLKVSQIDKLFFVKVDITSCFDTIPQGKLLKLINTLLGESQYRTGKHVEIKQLGKIDASVHSKMTTKYFTTAQAMTTSHTFSAESAGQLAMKKRRTVFVGLEQDRVWHLQQLQTLLRDHIQNNIVRIGRRYFTQTDGIPQGSVLSSLLCSFFYADFELQSLDFLDRQHSLLLRLIDDFLLITTEEGQAKRFIEAMCRGHASYGISINTEKSLSNFEVTVAGRKIPRYHGSPYFPYCGVGVNMKTLELSKDRSRRDAYVENSLTVDIHGRGGTIFQRRVLSALKIQMHPMLLDGTLNQKPQVIDTIFENFVETAMKMHRYCRMMPPIRRPGSGMIIAVCEQLMSLAHRTVKGIRGDRGTDLNRSQIRWIAAAAIAKVLSRKQSEYGLVLSWLAQVERETQRSMRLATVELKKITQRGLKRFKDHIY